MRTQITKINGVTPSKLHRLHLFLKSDVSLSVSALHDAGILDEDYKFLIDESGKKRGSIQASLLKSEYDPVHDTYTITIQVPLACELEKTKDSLFASRATMTGIFDALEIFPDQPEVRQPEN